MSDHGGSEDSLRIDKLLWYLRLTKSRERAQAKIAEGHIRVDGRRLIPSFLFEVKTPAESRGPWDYYKLLQTTPADEAYRPLADGGCPLVRG